MKALIILFAVGLLTACANPPKTHDQRGNVQVSHDNGAITVSTAEQPAFSPDQNSQPAASNVAAKMISPFTQ